MYHEEAGLCCQALQQKLV